MSPSYETSENEGALIVTFAPLEKQFFRYTKHVSVKFAGAVFIMDHEQ
jgi:hypothetical protein